LTPRPKKLWQMLHLDRIGSQMAALVLVSTVAVHAVIATIFYLNRPEPRPDDVSPGQLISTVKLIAAVGAGERDHVIADVAQTFPAIGIETLAGAPAATARIDETAHERFLRARLGSGFAIVPVPAAGDVNRVAIELPDHSWIAARLPGERRRPSFFGGPWMTALLFIVGSVSLLSLWATRALTRPLSAFATAAESFSLTGAPEPLPERGPREIRLVARALNRMRSRIVELIDDRTKMLAAISHDLRTPITRLRLRSEFIEDDGHRTQTLRDLDQMHAMLEAVLSFLRNGRNNERSTLIDLSASLQLICDQFNDTGCNVRYEGPEHLTITARPDDLHRAVTNLVENAVRLGREVIVRLSGKPLSALIEVEDDGPGIADERKRAMLEPFVRGDAARNMDEATGFGLGLAITHAIVDGHGGTLTLADRSPHGLIVRLELPRQAEAARLQAAQAGRGDRPQGRAGIRA
jgi:signal transduction histidine kinase